MKTNVRSAKYNNITVLNIVVVLLLSLVKMIIVREKYLDGFNRKLAKVVNQQIGNGKFVGNYFSSNIDVKDLLKRGNINIDYNINIFLYI